MHTEQTIHHRDGDPRNNDPANLRPVSAPARRLSPGTMVAIVGESPLAFVTEDTIEPGDDGVERMYRVSTWRTASELREVL